VGVCCDWSVRATIFRCLQAGSRPISFRCWRDPLRRSLILLEFSIASCNETRAATARAGAEHWMRLINCFGGDDPNKLPWWRLRLLTWQLHSGGTAGIRGGGRRGCDDSGSVAHAAICGHKSRVAAAGRVGGLWRRELREAHASHASRRCSPDMAPHSLLWA
jgi:hypothetical protein